MENHANIDCYKKEVVFTSLSKTRFKFNGTSPGTTPKVISMVESEKVGIARSVGYTS